MKTILTVLCSAFFISMQAQTIEDVLRSIERNNKSLQAQQQTTDAAKMEIQNRNNLEDPSVEYSPFFARGVDGMASSELVVTQGFDFPSLYAARRRSGKLQQEALERQQQAVRREILLAAKNLCLDLIRLNQENALLAQRKKNADELLVLFEERLAKGDANVLDVNKITCRLSFQKMFIPRWSRYVTIMHCMMRLWHPMPVCLPQMPRQALQTRN